MKKEVLEKTRIDYQKMLQEKKKLIGYKEELLKLLESGDVKRYLELLKCVDINYEPPTDEEIRNSLFNNVCLNTKKEDSNHILVYQGTYIKDENHITYDFDENASYKSYMDLETMEVSIVDTGKYSELEKSNTTIYPMVRDYDKKEYSKVYKAIRNWFFEELLSKSQEEVVDIIKDSFETKHENLKQKDIGPILENGLLSKRFDPKDFDERHKEDSFLEKYCLTDEQQKRLRLYRKMKNKD